MTKPASPHSFLDLARMRGEWKRWHEKQRSDLADVVFRDAGLDRPAPKESRARIPAAMRGKLEAFGREWEMAIASAAIGAGGGLYRARLTLKIDSIAEFHRWVEASFNPGDPNSGAVALFFESDGLNALAEETWGCYFYFVIERDGDPHAYGLADAPGVDSMAELARIP